MLFNDKLRFSCSSILRQFRLPGGIPHQGCRPRHLWAGRPTFRTLHPLQFSDALDASLHIEFTRATVCRASRPTPFSTADDVIPAAQVSHPSLGFAAPVRVSIKRLVGSPWGPTTVALEVRACSRWGGPKLSTLLGQCVPQRVLVGPPGVGRSGVFSDRLNANTKTRPACDRLGALSSLSRLGSVFWPDFTPEWRSAAVCCSEAVG